MGSTGQVIIAGKDCEDCVKSTFDETNKAKVMVYCSEKVRWYIFGQCVPCDEKVKRRESDEGN